VKQFEPLRAQRPEDDVHTRHIAAGPVQAMVDGPMVDGERSRWSMVGWSTGADGRG
jgi:hypothetical protein